jgi:molybdopterin biosynthesis enzyme
MASPWLLPPCRAGPRTFPVAGTAYAGTPPLRLTDPQECLRIMTGAVLPEGADTVIRYEDLQLDEGPDGRRATLGGSPKTRGTTCTGAAPTGGRATC